MMKLLEKCLALTFVALVGCMQPGPVPGPVPDLITASEAIVSPGGRVLRESRDAYRALDFYRGTIDVTVTTRSDSVSQESRKYGVFYASPGKFRLEGEDSNGDPIVITTDGREVHVKSTAQQSGRVPTPTSLKDALFSHSGVSAGATILLPSALTGIQWAREMIFLPQGDLLTAFATKAELSGSVNLDGQDCHRVVCEREIGTWIFYVDKETSLLRRVDQSATAAQMVAQRRVGGGGASGHINSIESTQIFDIAEFK